MTSLSTRLKHLIDGIRSVNPHAVDSLLAVAFTAAALLTVAQRVGEEDVFRNDDVFGVGLLLFQTLPIAARRVAPIRALIVSVAAIALHIALGYEGVPPGTFAALVILYSATSMSNMRGAIFAAAITAAGIAIYFAVDRGHPDFTAAVTTSATYAAAWAVGVYVRSRREYTGVVEERANFLEREREMRSREAVAEERARIARELHDIVGHALSLIVIQSGGIQRVLQSRPELVLDTLVSIEATGRQALTDMERMLGMLGRTDVSDEVPGPQPGIGDIEALAARVSAAGIPVEVSIQGPPVALPASVDLSAYRIVQEALTNVLKHAGPARARVEMRYRPDCLELVIVDNGQGAHRDGADDRPGRGRGLLGMRERVALFGGEIEAGPGPQGGFRVHAKLPLKDGSS